MKIIDREELEIAHKDTNGKTFSYYANSNLPGGALFYLRAYLSATDIKWKIAIQKGAYNVGWNNFTLDFKEKLTETNLVSKLENYLSKNNRYRNLITSAFEDMEWEDV